MRKLLSIFILALLSLGVQAEVWQARYGVAETFAFKLYNADGTLDVDEADGGTEVSVSCNEGAETTATNDFVDEGTFYSIALTATEMQCERVTVVVAATTTEVFFIQTSANASAMTPSYEANVGTVTDGALVAADFASDFITAAKIASDVSTEFSAAIFTVNATQISGDSGAADELELAFDGAAGAVESLGIARQGTAQSATSTTLVMDTGAAFADDTAIGMTIVACGSTQGYCQSQVVSDNTLSNDTLTVGGWPVTPSGTVAFYLFATAPGSGATDVNVVTIEGTDATNVLGTAQTGDAFARLGAPAGASVSADILAVDNFVDDVESRLGTPSNLGGGATVAANLSDIEGQTDDIGAAGAGLTAADDAVMTRLGVPAGASVSADIAAVKSDSAAILVDTGTTLDGKLDTVDSVVDAIKVKTDQLTFGVTNQLNVNVESMNAESLCGSGDSGTPWTGCP